MGLEVPALGEGGTVGEEVVEKAVEGVESRGNHPEEEGGVSPHVVTKGGGAFEASRHREITEVGGNERTETFSAEMHARCLIRMIPMT